MPMTTRDRQGKRTRELSQEVEDPDAQLGEEAGSTDLTLSPSPSNALSSQSPSSSYKEEKKPSTPPPRSALSRVPNIKYFQDQEIFVENLADLGARLSWDLIPGTTMKWLSYDDPEEEYNDERPHIKFGMILVGQLGAFLNLKVAENHFIPEKPEFSVQLLVEESTLDVLKDLLSRCGEGYAINNPLRIKVPESELLSDSFSSGDPFPNGFDGTSTTDTDDGPILAASAFTAGDKVAVQVWFGCYNFNNRSGPTFRLLKLWKLQPGVSGYLAQGRDPITPRKRRR
ncbi:hypothetical protein BKA65DRAFT_545881 [Rhexocercosporidium sp. MPI-PUGE-AT-0058]|nr:hypothetical protein BKA65DRAFT_545881 [Rhexocercosporidium sp. MPI-PUGE-AT-0058]